PRSAPSIWRRSCSRGAARRSPRLPRGSRRARRARWRSSRPRSAPGTRCSGCRSPGSRRGCCRDATVCCTSRCPAGSPTARRPRRSARLLTLANRAGVRAIGVWIADQSRKSRTANAAVVGLGRTRRILLYDTLATGFRPEEIEAVLAHELGHHVHGDVRRGLVVQGVLGLVTFWLADQALRAGAGRLGYVGVADPGALPWLALVLAVLGLVATPLVNAFSRRVERQADDFALALTRDPAGFIGAMERLATLNLAERRPHPLKEALLFSHPALDRRIARARAVA